MPTVINSPNQQMGNIFIPARILVEIENVAQTRQYNVFIWAGEDKNNLKQESSILINMGDSVDISEGAVVLDFGMLSVDGRLIPRWKRRTSTLAKVFYWIGWLFEKPKIQAIVAKRKKMNAVRE